MGIVLAACVPFLSTVYFYYFGTNKDSAVAVFAFSKLFLVVWPFAWVTWAERRPIREFLGDDLGRISILRGAASGLFFAAILSAGYTLAFHAWLQPYAGNVMERIEAWGSLSSYWTWAILISLVHSLIEEIYWRAFLFKRILRSLPLSWAAVAAGILFAMHHGVMYFVLFPAPLAILFTLGTAGAGVFWCVLYEKGGGLKAAWLSHAITDGILFILGRHLLGL